MKLAEALIQRADTQKRIQELRKRLNRNARVQEGDQPTEEPLALLQEVDDLTETLVELIQRINRTNAATEVAPDKSISDTLAERDILAMRQKVYRELAGEATSSGQDRYRWTRSEIKFQSIVDVADIQRWADLLAKNTASWIPDYRNSTGKSSYSNNFRGVAGLTEASMNPLVNGVS